MSAPFERPRAPARPLPAPEPPPFDPSPIVRRLRRAAEVYGLTLAEAERLHVAEGLLARLASVAASSPLVLRADWLHRLHAGAPPIPQARLAFWADLPLAEVRPTLQAAWARPLPDGVQIDPDVIDLTVETTAHRRAVRVWVPARFGAVAGLWVDLWLGRPRAAALVELTPLAGPAPQVGSALAAVTPAAALAEHLAEVCAPETWRWAAEDLWSAWRWASSVALDVETLGAVLGARGRDLAALDRLRRRKLGQSRDSRRVWNTLRADPLRGAPPELEAVVAELARRLDDALPPRTPRALAPPRPTRAPQALKR